MTYLLVAVLSFSSGFMACAVWVWLNAADKPTGGQFPPGRLDWFVMQCVIAH